MEIALLIALIISNFGWLLYFNLRDQRDRDERTELQNRIAQPRLVSPTERDKRRYAEIDKEAIEILGDNTPSEAEQAEIAAIGQVNPEGLIRNGE